MVVVTPQTTVDVVTPQTTVDVVVVQTIEAIEDNSIGHLIRIRFMEHETGVVLAIFHLIAPTVTLPLFAPGNNLQPIMLTTIHKLLHGFLTQA